MQISSSFSSGFWEAPMPVEELLNKKGFGEDDRESSSPVTGFPYTLGFVLPKAIFEGWSRLRKNPDQTIIKVL